MCGVLWLSLWILGYGKGYLSIGSQAMASPKHSTEVGSGENQSGFGRWWSPAMLMGVVLIVFGA